MVRLPTLAVLGVAVLEISTVFGAVIADDSSPSRHADDLRLVKTSDDDPGTWMTEEEKYERFTSKRLGFVDITDTLVWNHSPAHGAIEKY
jgi:bacterial leucyl aminopeptidase